MLARRPPREPDEGDLVRQAKLVVRSSCRAYEPEILGAQPGTSVVELAAAGIVFQMFCSSDGFGT